MRVARLTASPRVITPDQGVLLQDEPPAGIQNTAALHRIHSTVATLNFSRSNLISGWLARLDGLRRRAA